MIHPLFLLLFRIIFLQIFIFEKQDLLIHNFKISFMQQCAFELKQKLWSNLKPSFDKYANQSAQITIPTVEKFIVDTLNEQSQQQIDYVMKNIFRLDSDGSGSVSFAELGNFLFKRHCGQMSLQVTHKAGKMKKGSERKMSLEEFHQLMCNAYKFLGVDCPLNVAEYIFTQTDKDGDKLITYVQYFQVIDKYICKSAKEINQQNKNQVKEEKVQKVEEVPQGQERRSKLRIYMWAQLRKLYEHYIQGRSLEANDAELRNLVFSIVGDLSETQIAFVSSGLNKLNWVKIQFEHFAMYFILIIAELGLSRYSRNNPVSKKTLNKDEFVILFKNSFKFLEISKFKNSILFKIFAKIDKNNDGLISFEEYLDWVKRFLAVLKYFGDEFYVPEDDADIDDSSIFERDPVPASPKKKQKTVFVFSDYSFAQQVRERTKTLLLQFDADKDELFDEKEIHTALIQLLKENQYELAYVTRNVFRYDRDGDQRVTTQEMVNFSVEQHFGEMAIQRLHRKKFYSKGAERIMNKEEFSKTLNHALQFIQMECPAPLLDILFKEIDLDKDGWISYEVYFLFLRYYFGSLSAACKGEIKPVESKPLSEDELFLKGLEGLSAWDRLYRIICDQLREIFMRYDNNKNQVFEADQIEDILRQVFGFQENQISYIIFTYFKFDNHSDKAATFQELLHIILCIYFIEILFQRKYGNSNKEWISKKISLQEFIELMIEACYFIRIKPLKADLIWIFQQLDTDKDGFITFQQYVDFIEKYLGKGIQWQVKPKEIKPTNPNEIGQQENVFLQAIWDQLKRYFDKYDGKAKGFLNDQELKTFVIEVLNETSQRELDYVFWNLFRVDSNLNKEVDFPEFAPFILNHAGEISLQRFHKEQIKGKNSLKEEELYTVIFNGYKFLTSMPNQRKVISIIFNRIQTNGEVTYAKFLNWVHHALAARYKK